MFSQRVALGQLWMVEIVPRIVSHADSFHDPTRTKISDRSKRNDFLKLHFLKAEGQGCSCAFLGISVTPVIECQPPTNFNARRKRQCIAWDIEPDKPDEVLRSL